MTASQPLPLAELSPAEQAEIERFGIYEAEEKVEKVARAIFDVANPITAVVPDYWQRVTGGDMTRDAYRRQAAAAIAVMPASPAPCGDLSPSINFGGDSDAERLMCDLPVDHGGSHQHDNGDGLPPARWIVRDAVLAAPQTGERTTEETTGAMPADWLTAFNADGIPNWAALQAWNEADDGATVMAIKARAAALAGQHTTDEEAGNA